MALFNAVVFSVLGIGILIAMLTRQPRVTTRVLCGVVALHAVTQALLLAL